MNRTFVLIVTAFFIVTVLRVWGLFIADAPGPEARGGVLDLREWRLGERGTVSLNGEWAFYPGSFLDPAALPELGDAPMRLNVPGPWDGAVGGEENRTFGYGTYRLRVLLSEEDRERLVLAVRASNVRSAHRLYVSGALAGQSGDPGVDRDSTSPRNTPYVAEFVVRNGTLELVAHVSNYHYGFKGGIFDSFEIGTVQAIVAAEQTRKSVETAIAVGAVSLGLLFASLYGFRRQNPELLWFGSFFMFYALFAVTHGEKLLFVWWPSQSYEWQSKLQVLSAVGIYISILHFVRNLYPRYEFKPFVFGASALLFGWGAFCLASNVYRYTALEPVFLVVNALLSLYLICWLLRGVLSQRHHSIYVLIGSFCLFYEQVYLGLTFFGAHPNFTRFPYEIMIFVVSMTALLVKRFFDNLKQVEDASKALLRADRMKNEFLANTSHELRTPVHGIVNMASLGLDEGGLTPSQEERLRLIVATGRNLSRLLEDILDLARLNEGTLRMRYRPVDLYGVAAELWEILPYVAQDAAVRLENRIDPGLPHVWADDQRVQQVLFNLVHNAMTHANASTIRVEGRETEGYVEITVFDDGDGIPDDELDHIFEGFHQGRGGGGTPRQGAGLGLAIARKLVELQGGALTAESRAGEYSRFRFTLPVAAPSAVAEAAVAAAPDNVVRGVPWGRRSRVEPDAAAPPLEQALRDDMRGAARVLLVEDDPIGRKVVAEILAGEGCAVVSVADGWEAMLALESTPRWDAVVLDVSVPGKTGYELCRHIRERFSYFELPVLFLTARSQPEDLLAGFDAGANDYVRKPVEAAELKARVRTLLQLKQSVRDKLRMEMALIQAQIKPHFLFNALNTIASLSETDPDRMRDVLTDFGAYLKNSFDLRNLDRVVPFSMEWALVRSYLSIEQARFGDRLRVSTSVPEQANFYLPPLSIQPIVENALRHGILKRPEGGDVAIEVRAAGNRVRVEVTDNGVGFAEGVAAAVLQGRHAGGIGLANIHRRLIHLYGTGLEIATKPDVGTCVGFEIPWEKENERDDDESDPIGR